MIKELGHTFRPRIAAGYNDIGYHNAKTNLETALEIYQQLNDSSSAAVAGAHHHLGEVLRQMKDLEMAEQHLRKSLDIRVKLQTAQEKSHSLHGKRMVTTAYADAVAAHRALGQVWAEMGILQLERMHGPESFSGACMRVSFGQSKSFSQNRFRGRPPGIQCRMDNANDAMCATDSRVPGCGQQQAGTQENLDYCKQSRHILDLWQVSSIFGHDDSKNLQCA